MAISRRRFLNRSIKGGFGAALGAAGVRTAAKAVAPSDKVVVGVMGVGGRGTALTTFFAERPDVEIAYVCDVNAQRLPGAVKLVQDKKGKAPKAVGNFQRILEDKNVDAMVCATPDHWHSLATVLACQAGKDIYVEKPASHDIWEGRKMVEAARKYHRVVQVGMQNRSSSYCGAARELIQSGKLGSVHLVRVYNMLNRTPVERTPDSAPPEGFDWDMWLGPGPLRPYNPMYFRRVFWDFNGGIMTDDGIHQLDLARAVIGVSIPKSVHHAGGKLFFKDIAETPDTSIVTYEYDGLTLVFEETWWTPYMIKIPNTVRESTTQFPDWFPFVGTRIEIHGSDGMMILGRHGGGWQLFDRGGQKIASDKQTFSAIQAAHVENFINCIHSRKHPNSDVEEGHISAALCHMANISYRLGDRKVVFDSAKEAFVDDHEANQYLKRTYRQPWVVPENV
jgi:predicted dehydrogenase